MKIKVLFLCLIAQVAVITPTTKRNLQTTQKHLLQQQEHLREKTSNYPIIEVCPTKPPKKYCGGHEIVRLKKSIDLLKAQNKALKECCIKK